MKQLTQKLKDGHMQVLDVPEPVLGKGMVLVRDHYSLISADPPDISHDFYAAYRSLVLTFMQFYAE